MFQSYFWFIAPAFSLLSLGLSILWYNTLLESSEGTIDSKANAVKQRLATLSLLKNASLKTLGVGCLLSSGIGVLAFLGQCRGFSPFAFLFGFLIFLIQSWICMHIVTQATPRITTEFETSEKEGHRLLTNASRLIVIVLSSIATLGLSLGYWLLHVYYESNTLNVSMRIVTYLGHGFWNDAIRFQPSFQALILTDSALTTAYIFAGTTMAWALLSLFYRTSNFLTIFNKMSRLFLINLGLGVSSIILGIMLLGRYIDYPVSASLVPLFILGLSLSGLVLSRLTQTSSTIPAVTIFGLGSAILVYLHLLPIVGGFSLLIGLLFGSVYKQIPTAFRLIMILMIVSGIFYISGHFLSEGKAWFHISLLSLGILSPILFQASTWLAASLRSSSKDDDSPTLGAEFMFCLLWIGGLLALFKQQLIFLAHTTLVKFGSLSFTTLYAYINPSNNVYDLHTCDFSELAHLLNLTCLNPVVLLGFGLGLLIFKFQKRFLVSSLAILLSFAFGLPSLLGFLSGVLLYPIQSESDSESFFAICTLSVGLFIIALPLLFFRF